MEYIVCRFSDAHISILKIVFHSRHNKELRDNLASWISLSKLITEFFCLLMCEQNKGQFSNSSAQYSSIFLRNIEFEDLRLIEM